MADEDDQLMPEWERFYLYRVELYLIHKYQPELVHEMKITFVRARLRREGIVKEHDIIHSKEELFREIANDLVIYAPWKPKKSSHKGTQVFKRPGISDQYQSRFEEL